MRPSFFISSYSMSEPPADLSKRGSMNQGDRQPIAVANRRYTRDSSMSAMAR